MLQKIRSKRAKFIEGELEKGQAPIIDPNSHFIRCYLICEHLDLSLAFGEFPLSRPKVFYLESALHEVEQEIKLFPDKEQLYYLKGILEYQKFIWTSSTTSPLGQKNGRVAELSTILLENSLQSFSASLQINPKFDLAFLAKAAIYERMQKFDLAVENYNHFLKSRPLKGLIYLLRAENLRRLGRENEAQGDENTYDELVEIDRWGKVTALWSQNFLVLFVLSYRKGTFDDWERALKGRTWHVPIWWARLREDLRFGPWKILQKRKLSPDDYQWNPNSRKEFELDPVDEGFSKSPKTKKIFDNFLK